jgi:hypothetical protein
MCAVGNRKKHFWIALLSGIFFVSIAQAQQNDFGIWAGVSISHKFTQRLSGTVEEQIRLNQNATAIDQYFTDLSLEYSLSKKFKFAFGYRFINNFQQTYYSKRHRIYADLSYKTKFSMLQFILRTRLQEQQKDIYSSETGYIPAWYSRNKITTKLDLNRKYTPYASAEMMYLIKAPNVSINYIEKWRYCFGVEYDFNRMHSLDFYYLIQRDRMINEPITLYAFSINYKFTF